MQIQSASSSLPYSSTAKPASTAASEQKPDLEQMLENLRKDPAINDRITKNEDGSYDYNIKGESWSEKTFAARAIITELNGESFSLIGTDGMMFPSDSDALLFKQLTGYNLLTLGDISVVLDDNGFPPAVADQPAVKQALDFISDVMIFRNEGEIEGDLTSQNVGAILSAYNISPGSNTFIDQLLEQLGKSTADASVSQDATQQTQIEELLDLMST